MLFEPTLKASIQQRDPVLVTVREQANIPAIREHVRHFEDLIEGSK
jgi:hypothetical protein